jgi:hypothetical protein
MLISIDSTTRLPKREVTEMKSKYLVCVREPSTAGFTAGDFITVKADDMMQAALEGLRHSFKRNGKPTAPKMVDASVAKKSGPRHASGIPMVVNTFRLALDPAVDSKGVLNA